MSHQRDSSYYRIASAARKLGVSRQWVYLLIRQGHLRPVEIPGFGRAITDEELRRFRLAHRRIPKDASPRSITGAEELLARVSTRVGMRAAQTQRHKWTKVDLLPKRGHFPPGARGRRAWYACQYRRMVHLMRLRSNWRIGRDDGILALKLDRYYVQPKLLKQAMLRYLDQWGRGLFGLRSGNFDGPALELATEKRRLPGMQNMTITDRQGATKAQLHLAAGIEPNPDDTRKFMCALSLPPELMPVELVDQERPFERFREIFGAGVLTAAVRDATDDQLTAAWDIAREYIPVLQQLVRETRDRWRGGKGRRFNLLLSLATAIMLRLIQQEGRERFEMDISTDMDYTMLLWLCSRAYTRDSLSRN